MDYAQLLTYTYCVNRNQLRRTHSYSYNHGVMVHLIRVKKYYPKALFPERDLITARPVKKLVTVITGSRSKS